jgi:hypothetical protein
MPVLRETDPGALISNPQSPIVHLHRAKEKPAMKMTPHAKATIALALLAFAPAAFSQAPAPAAAAVAPAAAPAPAPPAAPAQVATPKDPKSPVVGLADGRGPTGPVEIQILEPKAGEVVPVAGAAATGSPVRLVVGLKNFETFLDPATRSGQAVAIVLDGLPYFSHFDASKQWTFKKIPPGTHTLRVVPIRPWGEPIREPGAFASVVFSVGEKNGKNSPEPGAPILTLLGPQGKVRKEAAAKVAFEFLVSGCVLAPAGTEGGCQVRYKLDEGAEATVDGPGPLAWEKLAPGKHKYLVALYRDAKVLPGPFNVVAASFEIEGEAPAAPAAAPVAPAAPAAPAVPAPKAN